MKDDNNNNENRIIIVGAGPGGLASAILLAGAGQQVTVLERMDKVGGRTSTMEQDGFKFDVGPTFFLYPTVLEQIFQSVGKNLYDYVDMKRLDPQYHLKFGKGGEIFATPDEQRMVDEIAKLSVADSKNFSKYMEENRRKLEAFTSMLSNPFHTFLDVFNPIHLKVFPNLHILNSLNDDLARFFKDERIRLGFTFQSKYLGMSPFNCPSVFSILSFLEYEYGVFHPIGGCGAVSKAMAKLAMEMGVDIHLSEPVEQLIFEGRKVIGAQTNKAMYHADSVVINADFARAMKRLVPNELRPNWSDKIIEKKKFSCSTFMMYLGIEGEYEHLQHHTIYLSKNYEEFLKEIEHKHVLPKDDFSFYVQNACRTDDTLAPEGCSTLYILVPVTHEHENVDWSKEKYVFRERVLKQLETLGITDIESRIKTEKIITPEDWDVDFEVHKGAVFNMAHSLDQMLFMRPTNRSKDVKGLYIVGGGTHPGSGLPVIYESARITSKLMAEDLGFDLSTSKAAEVEQIYSVGSNLSSTYPSSEDSEDSE